MAARGHRVIVFCRRGHYSEHSASYRGIELHYLPAVRQKHLETLTHTAFAAVHLEPSAAIVCMGVGNAPVVRLLETLGRRSVFNVDGADWQRIKWGGLARRYLRFCERLAAHSNSLLVADAQAVVSYYATEYGRATFLVAYGADPPADLGTTTLDLFGLKSDNYALFVGRLVPENGPHEILEACRLAGPPCQVVIAGDAPYSESYIESLHRTAPVGTVFTGYQFAASYQQLSAHARLFVLAASVGGTHPVLVEQMAAANCILARETDSNREVLGEAGVYWSTPQELAQLMKRLWSDDRERLRLGRKARMRASEFYDWERVTSRYLELCQMSQHATTGSS